MTTHSIISFLCGFALMGINVALMVFYWSLIFRKKFIALSISVIVFKYAFLGVMIYFAILEGWVTPLAFSLGIGMIVPSALIVAIFAKKDR